MKAPRGADGNPTFGFLPSPPTLPRIAARALVFCALAQRVEIEPPPGTPLDAGTLEGMNELLELSMEWLARQGLAAELTRRERAVLQQPVGTLDDSLREPFAHSGEAAGVIAWALRRAPLAAFDADTDSAAVAEALGWLDDAGAELGSTALLRTREEVGAYLDAVSAVHWRLRRQAEPPQAGDAPAGVSMARWQPDRYAWPGDVTPLELAPDEDLALGGRSIVAASPAVLLAAWQRVRERHRATLWLLGQHRDYEAVEFTL
jgi:Domain of unknown function (DUF4272)